MDTWLFLCDLCSLKKNLTVFPEASFNDCISDSLVRTSQRDRAKPFLFGSVGCCLTVNDVWIPDERAMPPLPTIPGSTAAGANSPNVYCSSSSLRPSRSNIEKASVGEKKLDVHCLLSFFTLRPSRSNVEKTSVGEKKLDVHGLLSFFLSSSLALER